MKGQLTKIASNKIVGKVTGEVGKFYLAHESTILTGGTIGFSMATTAVTYRNADKIKQVLLDASYALQDLKSNGASKEEINQVYVDTLKLLAPLVLPIVIFQAATIGCACMSKKQADKKIAEAAGALSIAQAAISQYQSFQKEAEETLGEKKYMKLQQDIDDRAIYEASFVPIGSKSSEMDQLIYEPITGQLIWSNADRINLAWARYKDEIQNDGETFVPLGGRFFDTLGLDSDAGAAKVFGYSNVDASKMRDEIYLDTTKVRVEGREMPALKITYYPTIRVTTELYE